MNTEADNLKSPGKGLGERIVAYGRMIRFSHTIFALPFALAAVVLANRQVPLPLRVNLDPGRHGRRPLRRHGV